jgi:hypothetical protein
MWDLNTIVRMNDEAQRRAVAIREHEERERQANEREAVVTLVACPPSQEADHHDAA